MTDMERTVATDVELGIGPFCNEDGDWWVPATVPYLEARAIVKGCMWESDSRLVYLGKETTLLDPCCEAGADDCKNARRVPAWHFEEVQKW